MPSKAGNREPAHLFKDYQGADGDGYVESGNFKFLGAPVGYQAFVEKIMKETIDAKMYEVCPSSRINH